MTAPCPRCWDGAYERCSRCCGTGTLLCEVHYPRCGTYRDEAVAVIDRLGCCARAVEEIAACCVADERLEVTT